MDVPAGRRLAARAVIAKPTYITWLTLAAEIEHLALAEALFLQKYAETGRPS